MYQQLVGANLSVVGEPEMCLAYVRAVFDADPKYPTAAAGWEGAEYKHTGVPPTNVCVPIWFSYPDEGHVAVWVHGTIYSTTKQGDKTFPSIEALVDYIGHGIEYLGWSEDVDGTRVVEPVPVHTETVKPVTWNVRSEPSTTGAILGIIHGGASYPTTVVANEWREILFNGQTGYVSPLAWSN